MKTAEVASITGTPAVETVGITANKLSDKANFLIILKSPNNHNSDMAL
jgi:hypothetical protein